MIIEDLIIADFEKAWFKENYETISKEEFEQAYCEYMDVSGLYKTKRFEQLAFINYLSIRVSNLKFAIQAQKTYLETFGEPFVEGFTFFKEKYKYTLTWDGNKDNFLKQLATIERKEKKNEINLSSKEKIFSEEQKKTIVEQKSLMQSRHEWIRNINILKKNGYVLDRNKSTVEELALVMKESMEEQQANEKQNA